MDDQVERMVEGRDRRNDPDRLLCGERPAVLRRGRQAHRYLAAGEGAEFIRGIVDAIDRAIRHRFDSAAIRRHAERFGRQRFGDEMEALVRSEIR